MFTPPASPLPTHTNPLDASPPSSVGSPSSLRLSPTSSSLSPSPSPSPSSSPTSTQPPTTFRPKSANDFVLSPPPTQRPRALSESLDTTRARKRRLARRTTMTVLLVPLALVLITLSTRYAAHPAFFDCFSGVVRDGGASEAVGANDWTTWHGASTHQHGLEHERRQVAGGVATASGATGSIGSSLVFPTATPSGSTSTTPTSSTSVPKIPSTPPVLPTPFPQPFDTTMASNFSTSACGDFVSNMTGTSAFRDCRAFSFLSQVSQEFLTAQTNVSDLNVDVWGTCNTKLVQDQCVANMAWFADNLQEQCKEDLARQNAMVVQSLQSLQLYDLLRQTACLADAKTGAYCYVEAAASTDPYDLYLYSLPFGTSVPPSSTPSCSTCSQSVLALFAEQATAFDGLRKTYNVAASSANAQCGAGYVALASGLPTSAAVANGARDGARRAVPGVAIAVLGAVSALLSYVS